MTDSPENKQNSYFFSETKSEKLRDRLVLSSIFLLGIAGLYFIVNNPIQKSVNDADKGKLICHLFGKNKALNSKLLKIEGKLMAKEQLRFQLQNKIDTAQYLLKIGDQPIGTFKSDLISYEFDKAGVYKIELQQKLDDEMVVVHEEYLELL